MRSPDASERAPLMVAGPFLLDRIRDPDGGGLGQHFGGNGLVVACVVARLGWPTRLVGRLAEDSPGDRLASFLGTHGVELLRQRPAEGPTKQAEIALSADGQWRTVATRPPRYPYLDPPAAGALEDCGALLLTGLCSLWRACPRAVEAWLDAARARDLPVSLGLNRLEAREASAILALIGSRDTLFCNRDEAATLWGLPAGDGASIQRALAVTPGGDRVVSLGPEGVLVRPRGAEPIHLPAEPAPSVVNTVGAGDVLCAVTTALRLQGAPLLDAVARAQRAASCAVQHPRWDGWLEGWVGAGGGGPWAIDPGTPASPR
jgi:sugar/nucleoside kinase (ribokinase family)